MKKEFKGNGKGKRPIVGYNPKSWYANYDNITWSRPARNSIRKQVGN